MGDEDVKALDEIQDNYPRDTSMCCTKIFQLWLDRQPKTSWRELLQALREPNIGLNELADTVEQELISINEGNLKYRVIGHHVAIYLQEIFKYQYS